MMLSSRWFYLGFVAWLLWLSPAFLISLTSFPSYKYDFLRFYFASSLVVLGSLSLYFFAHVRIRNAGLVWAVLWALVLLLVSWPYRHLSTTWLELYQLATFVMTFMLLGLLLVQKKWLTGAVSTFIHALPLLAFFYAVICLYHYAFALLEQQSNLATFLPWGFINIRYWSQVASWVLPLLPLSLLISPIKDNPRWRFLVYFSLAVWVWVLILSTARGSMFSLLVSAAICTLVFKGQSKEWFKIMGKGVLLGLMLWVLLSLIIHPYFVESGQLRQFSTSSSGRTVLWQEALVMSWQNFPFGMGPFSWVTHDYFTEAADKMRLFGHPHNHVLLWAAEYGWVSILPLLALVGYALKRLRRLVHNNQFTVMHIAFLASVLAACSHSLLSAVFITPYSLIVGLAVLSLFWGLLHEDTVASGKTSTVSGRLFKTAAVVTLVLGMLWLNFIYAYYQQSRQVIEDRLEYTPGINSPRFFEQTVILKD